MFSDVSLFYMMVDNGCWKSPRLASEFGEQVSGPVSEEPIVDLLTAALRESL